MEYLFIVLCMEGVKYPFIVIILSSRYGVPFFINITLFDQYGVSLCGHSSIWQVSCTVYFH